MEDVPTPACYSKPDDDSQQLIFKVKHDIRGLYNIAFDHLSGNISHNM